MHEVWGQFDGDLGFGTVTYIPAFHDYTTQGAGIAFLGHIKQDQYDPLDDTFSQEFRLTSPNSSPIKWVGGVFYYSNLQHTILMPVWFNASLAGVAGRGE